MMAAAPDTLNLSILARDYIKAGWALVPIPDGTKGPNDKGWNLKENCVTTVEDCRRIKGNVGLAHAYSRTCVLDLDDFAQAGPWLAERGVDLDALWGDLGAIKISSGKPNRGKLLYRLPSNVAPLPSKKVGGGVLEFRCAAANGATVQDVLPPSVHPDTGRPYTWEYDELLGAHWSNPPELPEDVLRVWLAAIGGEQRIEPRLPQAERPARQEKEPLGLSREELRRLIYQEGPDDGYDNWLAVGFALHHEMRGALLGLELWDEWSSTGTAYKGWDDMERKWASFGRGYTGREKTIRSMMQAHGVATLEDFEDLGEPEREVAARAEKFAVCSAGEFAAGPPQEWIIKGVLPKAQIGMVYGESTAGKSFVVIDMLAAIARGEPWRGLKTKALRVVLIVAEGAGGAKGRMRAYEQHHGVRLSDYPFGIIQDRPNLHGKGDHKRLAAQIKAWGGADLVVVDTLAQSSAGANENSGEDMGTVLEHCHKLGDELNAMVLLVHHAGKNIAAGARGWSGLKGAMDVELEVSRHPITGRSIRLSKSKDGEDGQAMGFKLHVVMIGEDEDGDSITSCVVEHSSAAVPSVDPKDALKPEHRAVLQVLTEAGENGVSAMHWDDLRRASVGLMEIKGKVDNRMRDAGKAVEKLESLGYLVKDDGSRYSLAEKD